MIKVSKNCMHVYYCFIGWPASREVGDRGHEEPESSAYLSTLSRHRNLLADLHGAWGKGHPVWCVCVISSGMLHFNFDFLLPFCLSVLPRWRAVWLYHCKGSTARGRDQSLFQANCFRPGLRPQPRICSQRPKTGTKKGCYMHVWENRMRWKINLGLNFFFLFQENLLIDEDQNLKLIDFGLCAKPKVSLHVSSPTVCRI